MKKPGPPTSVVAKPVAQGAVVSWGPPLSDGGSPVTGYSVTVGLRSHLATCATTGSTTCTISGLRDGRKVHAKVRAVNGVGTSQAAQSGTFTPGLSPDCANLTPGANLQYCDFRDASFDGLNLAGADLWGANIVGASFGGADLVGTLFGGDTLAQSDLTTVNFSNADMEDAILGNTYIYSTSFDGADLTNASFDGATLIFVGFSDANLTGSDIGQAELLQNIDWSNTICPDGTNSDSDGDTCINNLG